MFSILSPRESSLLDRNGSYCVDIPETVCSYNIMAAFRSILYCDQGELTNIGHNLRASDLLEIGHLASFLRKNDILSEGDEWKMSRRIGTLEKLSSETCSLAWREMLFAAHRERGMDFEQLGRVSLRNLLIFFIFFY